MSETPDNSVNELLGITANTNAMVSAKNLIALAQDDNTHIPPYINRDFFRRYCKLFAQGMQWVHTQYPDQKGPRDMYVGSRGEQVLVDNVYRFNFQNTPHFHFDANDKDNIQAMFISIPFEDIIQFQKAPPRTQVEHKNMPGVKLTSDEAIFLYGVEEAYHAIQMQNLEIRNRLDGEIKQEQARAADAAFAEFDFEETESEPQKQKPKDPYDDPYEKDAAKIKLAALKQFRARAISRA
jgi:hypothetical protein